MTTARTAEGLADGDAPAAPQPPTMAERELEFRKRQKERAEAEKKLADAQADGLIPIGVADVKREGKDLTIIATSSMVQVALAAAKLCEEVGIDVEVVDPRTMWPLDEKTLIESAKKTSRCIVMDEGYGRYGVSAELGQVVSEGAFYYLDAPVTRLCAMHVPIPFSPSLEDATVPNEKDVVRVAQQLCKRT